MFPSTRPTSPPVSATTKHQRTSAASSRASTGVEVSLLGEGRSWPAREARDARLGREREVWLGWRIDVLDPRGPDHPLPLSVDEHASHLEPLIPREPLRPCGGLDGDADRHGVIPSSLLATHSGMAGGLAGRAAVPAAAPEAISDAS